MARQIKEEIKTNHSLLKVITPMGLKFFRNKLVVGENIGRIFGAVKYPGLVDYGLLSDLTNIPNTVATLSYNPIDSGEFVDALNRSIRLNEGIVESAKDHLTKSRAKRPQLMDKKQ